MNNPLDALSNVTKEQITPIAKTKADEIIGMFLPLFSELPISEDEKKSLANKCALAHIKPFKLPLEGIDDNMKQALNGAALERLELVVTFWQEVTSILESEK